MEKDDGPSLIVVATNHPEVLDRALFRRFDDVIAYDLPTPEIARGIVENRLSTFSLKDVEWSGVLEATAGLSQAEIARAADEAAKGAVLSGSNEIGTIMLIAALQERHADPAPV